MATKPDPTLILASIGPRLGPAWSRQSRCVPSWSTASPDPADHQSSRQPQMRGISHAGGTGAPGARVMPAIRKRARGTEMAGKRLALAVLSPELLPPDRPFAAALVRVRPAGLLRALWVRQPPGRAPRLRLRALAALNIGALQAFSVPGSLPAGGRTCCHVGRHPAADGHAIGVADRRDISGMCRVVRGFDGGAWYGCAAALLGTACRASGAWPTRRWQLALPVPALAG